MNPNTDEDQTNGYKKYTVRTLQKTHTLLIARHTLDLRGEMTEAFWSNLKLGLLQTLMNFRLLICPGDNLLTQSVLTPTVDVTDLNNGTGKMC